MLLLYFLRCLCQQIKQAREKSVSEKCMRIREM